MADPSCQGASPPVHDVLRSAYHLLDTSRGLDATCSRGEELARRAAECRACIAGVAGVLAALGDPEADALASCEAMRPGGTLAAGRGDGGQQDDPPGLLRAQEAAGAAARGASDPMDTSTHDSAAEPPAGAGASPGDRAAAGPDQSGWQAPPHSVPIHANVITFDWSALSAACQFDVVVMDPPWQVGAPCSLRAQLRGGAAVTQTRSRDTKRVLASRPGTLAVANARTGAAFPAVANQGRPARLTLPPRPCRSSRPPTRRAAWRWATASCRTPTSRRCRCRRCSRRAACFLCGSSTPSSSSP